MNRVVVTGIGLITALGTGIEKSWKRIVAGETGVGRIESYDSTDMPVQIAAEVKDFDAVEFGIEKKRGKEISKKYSICYSSYKNGIRGF